MAERKSYRSAIVLSLLIGIDLAVNFVNIPTEHPKGAGRKCTAFFAQYQFDRLFMGIAIAVNSRRKQSVVNIRQTDDMHISRNVFPPQPLRVSAAIPAFMVVQTNLMGIPLFFFALQFRQYRNHLCA